MFIVKANPTTAIIVTKKSRNSNLMKMVEGTLDIMVTKGSIFGYEVLNPGQFNLYPTDDFTPSKVGREFEMLTGAFC